MNKSQLNDCILIFKYCENNNITENIIRGFDETMVGTLKDGDVDPFMFIDITNNILDEYPNIEYRLILAMLKWIYNYLMLKIAKQLKTEIFRCLKQANVRIDFKLLECKNFQLALYKYLKSEGLFQKESTYYKVILEYANKMRNNPTKAEKSFANKLNSNNIEYKQQKVIVCNNGKMYIADFVVGHTIIEIDGEYHLDEKQIQKDKIRTKDLEEIGYKVIRINNSDASNYDMSLLKNMINYERRIA